MYAIQTGAVATRCFLFFQLLSDTATLGILAQKLRMLKARGCKQRLKSDPLYRTLYAYTTYSSIIVYHIPQNPPNSSKQCSYHTREPQRIYGTPVQLLYTQTEAVAYKPTLARPSARNSHYGIGEGRCGGCEPSSRVVDELWLTAHIPVYLCCRCCKPLSLILPNKRADTMLSTRRARSASGCCRLSLGVETVASASCARRCGICWAMVAVARF